MNFQDFLINAIDTCKSKYIAIPEQEKERYGKHFEALCSKIFGILRSENPHLDSLIAEYSLEGTNQRPTGTCRSQSFYLICLTNWRIA
ncbi:uncharacterized protein LOC108107296 isoform X3 [Drosophila eugracilis]|uniref:uncharacterized protein LOC108107296 isoform X3 n=1 Tax=Drosophila eugracilis TaxID=29029 RepID=UPI001BD9912B|nr:uncharacterized protein LOC108107296 isoform X3 [Drosophila eugracilis]